MTCQHYNKTYKTETGLNDNDTTASRTIEYPWSQTGKIYVYVKVVFRCKTLFLLPSGSCGERDIEETTRLLNEWTHDSPLNGISHKAVMLMPNLLLQKPSKNSKSKDHELALERRLELWHKGEFEELYFEGETVQVSLKTIRKPSSNEEISKKFKQYMAKGNTNSALNLLTNNMENGVYH